MQKIRDYSIHVGEKYGMLTILAMAEPKFYIIKNGYKKIRNRFKVQCDCGIIKEVDCSNLLNLNTISCGCYLAKIISNIHKLSHREIEDAVERKEYRNYLYGAKKRNLPFEISYIKFLELSQSACVYCGNTNSKNAKNETGSKSKLMNGIDRVDSSLGYTIINCVPCCKNCNYMKRNLSKEEFLSHIEKIHTFQLIN